jgi:uncharacterized protein (DUF1499 family)
MISKKMFTFIFVGLFCLLALVISAKPVFNISLFSGQIPQNLGVKQGLLESCPVSPNCVVSQNGDDNHKIEPIDYTIETAKVKELLLKVLTVVPRTKIIEQTDNYIRTESASALFGFIDDVEFYFPDDEKVIHLRSASRLGESDLGVNRRRLEQIRLAMQDLMSRG